MEQREVWDTIAEKWDGYRVCPTEEVIDFLKGKSGKVLDLGCGSGRHCLFGNLEFGSLLFNRLNFYGVDFSEKLLELAKDKDYVELKKGDVFDVPYSDGFFDFVVFSRVLHCVESLEKRQKSLREIYRVLKFGGEALITTWGKSGCKRMGKNKEGFIPWSIFRSGGTDAQIIQEKVVRYTYVYNMDELLDELKGVGFEVIRIEENRNILAIVRKPVGT